jgi:hypothetical protein
MKFVRPGARQVEASSKRAELDPIAFFNVDGRHVLIVKASAGSTFTVFGLPGGVYGVKYTTSSEFDVNGPEVSTATGGTIRVAIPEAGVVTIYPK